LGALVALEALGARGALAVLGLEVLLVSDVMVSLRFRRRLLSPPLPSKAGDPGA
jgi:hypothetical protein